MYHLTLFHNYGAIIAKKEFRKWRGGLSTFREYISNRTMLFSRAAVYVNLYKWSPQVFQYHIYLIGSLWIALVLHVKNTAVCVLFFRPLPPTDSSKRVRLRAGWFYCSCCFRMIRMSFWLLKGRFSSKKRVSKLHQYTQFSLFRAISFPGLVKCRYKSHFWWWWMYFTTRWSPLWVGNPSSWEYLEVTISRVLWFPMSSLIEALHYIFVQTPFHSLNDSICTCWLGDLDIDIEVHCWSCWICPCSSRLFGEREDYLTLSMILY